MPPRCLSLVTLAASCFAAPSFYKDVRPILQKQCQGCHQPATKQADLMLTSYELFKAGGRSGPAFMPGDPEKSLVMAYLKGIDNRACPSEVNPLRLNRLASFNVG